MVTTLIIQSMKLRTSHYVGLIENYLLILSLEESVIDVLAEKLK